MKKVWFKKVAQASCLLDPVPQAARLPNLVELNDVGQARRSLYVSYLEKMIAQLYVRKNEKGRTAFSKIHRLTLFWEGNTNIKGLTPFPDPFPAKKARIS